MANKKLVYNIENGKIKESTNSFYDDVVNEINVDKILTASVPSLPDGILSSNNKILYSSTPENNQILLWDNITGSWLFKSTSVNDGTISIPEGSAISGTLLNNVFVKTLEGVTSGTLSVYNGGTGLTNSDFPIDQDSLLIADGTNKLKFFKKDEALKIGTRPHILAPLTESSANDSSYNNNVITRINGSYVINAPSGGGWGFAASNGKAFQSSGGQNAQIKIDNASINTGDFTSECWVNLTGYGTAGDASIKSCLFSIHGSSTAIELGINSSGQLNIYPVNGRPAFSSPTLTVPLNQWCHIALVRKGILISAYLNGVKTMSIPLDSVAQNMVYSTEYVGSTSWGAAISGFLFEYSRVSYAKTDGDIARYFNNIAYGLQSQRNRDYTPLTDDKLYKPTVLAPFTSTAANDISSNVNAITRVKGQIVAAPAGLFGGNALSSSYDANAANYTAHINTPFSYNGDFTAECWTYLANVGGTIYDISRSTILVTNNLFGINVGGPTQFGTSGYYCLYTSNLDVYTDLVFKPNQWVHIALVRKGNKLRLYADGVPSSQEYTITNTSLPELNKIYVGSYTNANWNANGLITEVSMVQYAKTAQEIRSYCAAVRGGTRGRATKDYTTKFDNNLYRPHVLAPLTGSATNDVSYNNNAISLHSASYVTNAPITPFGDTNALSCSYSGDTSDTTAWKAVVTSPQLAGNFTAECWVYLANNGTRPAADVTSGIFGVRQATSGIDTIEVFVSPSGQFTLWAGGPNLLATSNPALYTTNNTWQHLALVRDEKTIQLYVNGVASSKVNLSNASLDDQYVMDFIGSVQWGGAMNGYITEYIRVPYAKTASQIKDYYVSVINGSQGRTNKDYIGYSTEPAKLNSAAVIANPQGNGWVATPVDDDTYLDTWIFNYY